MVAQHRSIREMARDLDCGIGTIQSSLARLETAGLVKNSATRQARMRKLTRRGSNVLHRERLRK
jgi:DNA-binding transcriptional regulator YhcF (GntR family)